MAAASKAESNTELDGNISEEDGERKVRRLRELYHGRFTGREATTLLEHHNWDIIATNTFILDALPGELRDVLGEDEWQVVNRARKDNVLRELARLNRIGREIRQFACRDCDNVWWRHVPIRKPVSRCFRCRQKYDAIPREKEWGVGQMRCVCSHEFKAFAMMDLSIIDMSIVHMRFTGKSKQLCHRCYSHLCEPTRILPPMRDESDGRGHGRRRGRGRLRGGWSEWRQSEHSCTAPKCYNRRDRISPTEPEVDVCVHPNSLGRKVPTNGSDHHVSSGSTVNTFLSQGNILNNEYEPSLADIDENGSGGADIVIYSRS